MRERGEGVGEGNGDSETTITTKHHTWFSAYFYCKSEHENQQAV